MGRPITTVLALMLLGGCASSSSDAWVKAGTTEAERGRDTADCLQMARRVTPSRQGPKTSIDQDRYRECMQGRGYTAGPAR
ncbi:MAG TPA: hypothetical protein VIE36_06915 [Methylomirabilota bacterium]